MRLPVRLPTRLAALTLAAALALTGCSGEEQQPSGDSSSAGTPSGSDASPTEADSPYLDVPDGVDLTAQGSTLSVGDTATVAYEPKQGKVGALDILVTSLEKASFKQFVGWELTKKIRKTAPYFVRAKVTNVGETNLGGRPVPLYIVDGKNRLIESSIFTGTFKPCDGASFPKKFKNGDTVKACMVYLAPGKGELIAASFRPTQEFNPITWEGEVTPAKGSQPDKKKDQGKQKQKDKQGGGNNG